MMLLLRERPIDFDTIRERIRAKLGRHAEAVGPALHNLAIIAGFYREGRLAASPRLRISGPIPGERSPRRGVSQARVSKDTKSRTRTRPSVATDLDRRGRRYAQRLGEAASKLEAALAADPDAAGLFLTLILNQQDQRQLRASLQHLRTQAEQLAARATGQNPGEYHRQALAREVLAELQRCSVPCTTYRGGPFDVALRACFQAAGDPDSDVRHLLNVALAGGSGEE
jgi:hypothetical protein